MAGPPMAGPPMGGPPMGGGPPMAGGPPAAGPPMPGPPMSAGPPMGGPPMPGPPMMGGPPMGGPPMGGPPMGGGPPMMGGPPMGGPPMGGMGMGMGMGGGKKKKKAALPKREWGKVEKGVEMKKLQWKKVGDKKVNNSDFWKNIVESGYDNPEDYGDIPDDFTERFSRPKAKGKKKKEKKGGDKKKATEQVEAPSFMEGKRQQNVGMKLGALKLKSARDFERMRSWVLKLNTTALSQIRKDAVKDNPDYNEVVGDIIGNIINSVPDETEQQSILDGWDGKNFQHAGRPDQYWLTMRLIPDVKQRATAWRMKVTTDGEMEFYRKYVDVLIQCYEGIKENESLHKFFGIIIRFGNFMNQKKKFQCRAFELKSLDSVLGCKARDSQTLLGYIVKFCREHHKELLSFVEELEFLKNGARAATAVKDRETEITNLFNTIKDMKKFVGENPTWSDKEFDTDIVASLQKEDMFDEVMGSFIKEKFEEAKELVKSFESTVEKCESLGEDLFYKKEKGDPDFHHFGLIDDFRQKVKDEIEHQEKAEAALEKARKREQKSKSKSDDKKKKKDDDNMLDKLSKADMKRKLKKKKRKPRGTVMGKKSGGAAGKVKAKTRRKRTKKTRRNTIKNKTGGREVEQTMD